MTKWLFILCIQHLHAGQSRKVLSSFLLLMRCQECCPIACMVVVINAYANLIGKFNSSLSPAAGIIYTGSPSPPSCGRKSQPLNLLHLQDCSPPDRCISLPSIHDMLSLKDRNKAACLRLPSLMCGALLMTCGTVHISNGQDPLGIDHVKSRRLLLAARCQCIQPSPPRHCNPLAFRYRF